MKMNIFTRCRVDPSSLAIRSNTCQTNNLWSCCSCCQQMFWSQKKSFARNIDQNKIFSFRSSGLKMKTLQLKMHPHRLHAECAKVLQHFWLLCYSLPEEPQSLTLQSMTIMRVIMMMRKVFLGVLLCNWEQIFNENFETLGHLIMYLKI